MSVFTQHFASLKWRLFSYFSLLILVILITATGIESLVINRLLMLSESTQHQLLGLATQADELVKQGDIDKIAKWEANQDYVVYVLDENKQVISGREMHPHNRFKLNYLKHLHHPMGDRVQKPLIGLPLENNLKQGQALSLIIQLNPNKHPALYLDYYLWSIRIAIGLAVIFGFTRLLTKYLIRPLEHLQSGSKALAQGELDTRISQHFSPNEREFYVLAAEFDKMAEQVQKSMTNQQRLLRDVSHELRTPLARQELALHLIESTVKHSDTAELQTIQHQIQQGLQRLRSEGEQMAQLITSILDFSRLNNAYTQLNPEVFPLDDIRNVIMAGCGFETSNRQQITWDQTSNASLYTDKQYLHRAIENIVRNSIKYAGPNANININTTMTRLNEQEWVTIDIVDDGQGIPQSQLETLFNPFTRIDDARHASQGGYGLGLAIVKQCRSLLGGTVKAENVMPQGLRTSLSFPANIDS